MPDGVCIDAVDQTLLNIRAGGAASAFGQGGCWRVSSSLATTWRAVALSRSAGTRATTLAWPSGVQSGILAVLELLTIRFHCDSFFIVHGAVRASLPGFTGHSPELTDHPTIHYTLFSRSMLKGSATLLPSRYKCNRGTHERCTHRNSEKEPFEDAFWLCAA